MNPRRVIRQQKFVDYIGLQRSQQEELAKSGELFDVFAAYEGGRAKIAYADEIALWQIWRDAKLAGETTLKWRKWREQHASSAKSDAESNTAK